MHPGVGALELSFSSIYLLDGDLDPDPDGDGDRDGLSTSVVRLSPLHKDNVYVTKKAKRKKRIPLALALLVIRLKEYAADVIERWLPLVAAKIRLLYATLSARERSTMRAELHRMGRIDIIEDFNPTLTPWSSSYTGVLGRKRLEHVDSDDWVELSKSLCWQASDNYYRDIGVEAWTSNDVPCEISSSRFVAVQYKNIIDAWRKSCGSHGSKKEDHTYVVEIGSGHCALAYRLARAFANQLRSDMREDMHPSNVTVVMTDFHEDIIRAQLQRPEFQELVNLNVLDGAVLDLNMLHMSELRLLSSGKAIGLDENAKVVFILNYVLDSLPCDVINVKRSKESREAWIGVVPKESSSVSGLHMRRLDPVPNVLCQFLKRFHCEEEQWMLWPTNALRALRTLRESNVGNKVFIIGDKMVDTMDASNWAETIPGFDKHGSGGCISVAVDERILAESVFEGMHGLHSSSSRMEEGFAISVFYGDSLTLKMEYDFPSFFISDYDRFIGWLRDALDAGFPGYFPDQLSHILSRFDHDYILFELLRWRRPLKENKSQYEDCWTKCWRQRFAINEAENRCQTYHMAQWCYFTEDEKLKALAGSLLRKALGFTENDQDSSLKTLLKQARKFLAPQRYSIKRAKATSNA